jgi:hypothetical protein
METARGWERVGPRVLDVGKGKRPIEWVVEVGAVASVVVVGLLTVMFFLRDRVGP